MGGIFAVAATIASITGTENESLAHTGLPSGYDSHALGRHNWTLHDPSAIVALDGWLLLAVTGKENTHGYTCGLELWYLAPGYTTWRFGQCLLTDKPDWVDEEVPTNDGAFWAPGFLRPRELYYSVSAMLDSGDSCIGRLIAHGSPPHLTWIDSGEPVTCTFAPEYDSYPAPNSIDPDAFIDEHGDPYLVYGGGHIYVTALESATGLQRNEQWWEPMHAEHSLVASPNEDGEWIEAPYIHYRSGFYYLFANWGDCCRGLASTYTIVVGRSRQPMGPFRDRNGNDMREGGGSPFLETSGDQIGPGHAGIFSYIDVDGNPKDVFTYHFYDRSRQGASWVAARRLRWVDGWPLLDEAAFDFREYWLTSPP